MGRRADAKDSVRYHIWSGEYDPEEVFIIVDEEVFECEGNAADEKWLRAAIKQEVARKRKAEKSWPKVTDCDRLDAVFDALPALGILAEHLAGFTQSDGFEIVSERYREEGGKRSGIAGYCFYTTQDMEGAMGRGSRGMYLAYGHFSGDGRKGAAIGRRLREALEQAGFTVEWNGSVRTRIFLSGFHWQRRGP